MLGFEERARLAATWLIRRQVEETDVAGWGWVPDVPINPQNTAEAVCALAHAGVEVPNRDKVCRLLTGDSVSLSEGQQWSFRTTIDLAWRLRALRCINPDASSTTLLLQDLFDLGMADGWSFGSSKGGVSVVATGFALLAIAEVEPGGVSHPSVLGGWATLLDAIRHQEESDCPAASVSVAMMALSSPTLQSLATQRSRRLVDRGGRWLLEQADSVSLGVEEEVFDRDGVADRWRHLTLSMALTAISRARPASVVDPAFRTGLQRLCSLQEIDGANAGAYRTSSEGFITSYATAQGLEALAATEQAALLVVSPADMLDLALRAQGRHHSDPQCLTTVGGRSLLLNSYSAFAGASTTTVLAVVAAIFAVDPSWADAAWRKAIFAIVVLVATAMWISYMACRLPTVSNARVVAISVTVVTAVVLPIMFFVL